MPESVTQKAGPTPDAGFLAFSTASVEENIVDIKEPIDEVVPFPPETPHPETTVLHLADVDPAFSNVALEKFSTRESNAFSLEAMTFTLRFFAGIMQLYLL